MYTFEEEQRFRQVWLWVVMVPISLVLLSIFSYGAFQQLVRDEPFGAQPMPDTLLIIMIGPVLLITLGTPLLFAILKLTVRVTDRDLEVRFFPFLHQRYPLRIIDDWEVRRINPLSEYGGWGIRISLRGRGWGYTVSGYEGVEIEFANGKRMFLGSQRAEELSNALYNAIYEEPEPTPRLEPDDAITHPARSSSV